MSELATLGNLLDRLNKLITDDRSLTIKALGLLLLGKKFNGENEEEKTDPTDALLNERPNQRRPQIIEHPNL